MRGSKFLSRSERLCESVIRLDFSSIYTGFWSVGHNLLKSFGGIIEYLVKKRESRDKSLFLSALILL